jgi:hypothetical protein
MAIGTGLVMGYMAFYIVFGIILGIKSDDAIIQVVFIVSLIFFLVSQVVMASCFWGKRRGEFEYSFLEKSALKKKINRDLGTRLKEVKRELKLGGVNSAHEKLIATRNAFPENFVVHFMFAHSCERLGLAEAAIEAYETARKLLPESAQTLITYIEKQAQSVKLYGPSNISTAPGLQYLMY